MRKQKTKRSMMGVSLLAVMGITLLAPGVGMNEVKATSTPSDVETETDVDMINAAPSGSVAIDSTTFPDEVFRQYVKDNCDKNSDGQLSEDERLQDTRFYMRNMGIASLEGIEFFPNLSGLICNDNDISSLDVSNNTALTLLECTNNNLSSLDVSNNTALTSLYCSGNNLNNLDVSNNTSLTGLQCIRNNLSNLDVSRNIALTHLYCDNNNLNSLDVSNNTALTDLGCDWNNISNLDISNNTALTHLRCSRNNLSSLDVSKNTALTDLRCYENNLSSLDLSKNINLNYFDGDTQTISIPMYKNGKEYYIDLSGLPIERKYVSETSEKGAGATYNSISGRINLSYTQPVGYRGVRYSYETNGPASLSNTKMTVVLIISEVKNITEPTTEEPSTEQPSTEQPTTEQPSTEQPSTEQPSTEQPSTEQPSTEQPSTEQPSTEQPSTAEPVKVEPAPTQTDNSKAASPKTGDTAPLYPVIFLLLASFAGGVTLYIRRKQK